MAPEFCINCRRPGFFGQVGVLVVCGFCVVGATRGGRNRRPRAERLDEENQQGVKRKVAVAFRTSDKHSKTDRKEGS